MNGGGPTAKEAIRVAFRELLQSRIASVLPFATASAALVFLGACASQPEPRVLDQRGRRIVPIDRPTVATEHARGRRTIRVDLEGVEGGTAGFTFAIELPDAGAAPPGERLLVLPSPDAKAILLVAGKIGQPYSNRDAHGSIRLRDFEDRALAVVDLEFEGVDIDPRLQLPIHLFREGEKRLRLSGSFTAYH